MKRLLTIGLLLLYASVCFAACNNKEIVSGNESKFNDTNATAETIVQTDTMTETAEISSNIETESAAEATESAPAAEPEKITLPYISDHTAAELVNYNVPELVALMGYDFDVEFCGERLVYYTSGGLCFYNDETLPGYAFFIDEAEGDISRLIEAGKSDEEAYAEIKNNILSGKYEDYEFFCIYGGAKYNDEITSDMHYVDLSEILGSYDLAPIVGSMAMRQPISIDPPATIYYESVYGKITAYDNESRYDVDEAKALNPQAEKIAVIKETEKHH